MKTRSYLNICGVPTKVVTFGKGLAEINGSEEGHDLILIIPGNPGNTLFYEEFLQEIYNRLGYSVWIISHAGHEVPKNSYGVVPALSGNEALYDIPGQITHKIAFIEQYIPENTRLHLIGHSIGAYIILQLLKVPFINSKVVGNYLLFPVFERLSETPNAYFGQKLVNFFWLVTFLLQIFALLPIIFQKFLLEIYGSLFAVPKNYRAVCVECIHPTIMEKVVSMLISELAILKDRDNEILTANKDKIKMYYGVNDGWAPQDYYFKLKIDLPDVDAELCSHNYDHAFVLRHSKEVGNLVADWILMKKL